MDNMKKEMLKQALRSNLESTAPFKQYPTTKEVRRLAKQLLDLLDRSDVPEEVVKGVMLEYDEALDKFNDWLGSDSDSE